MFCIPKHKWDRDSVHPALRVISDASANRPSSVNDLCYRPQLIAFHVQASDICNALSRAGPGAQVFAVDVKQCFRQQRTAAQHLHLFVYRIRHPTGEGWQFYVDLANSFGWRPSEYGWACILAVLMWHFRRSGIPDLLSYVDNFFIIVPKSDNTFQEKKRRDSCSPHCAIWGFLSMRNNRVLPFPV